MTDSFVLSPDLIPAEAFMTVWVVYDHPKDFPTCYVARPQFILKDHTVVPCKVAWLGEDLDKMRDALAALGLTCLMRSPGDDPKILETWL